MRPRLLIAATAVAAGVFLTGSLPLAQTSDLDVFMKQVLTRRDDNWKKLQQYTLEEDETFQLVALNGRKLYGFKREYSWYPSTPLGAGPQDAAPALASGDAIFVRSPISADGVRISDEERRKAEANWLKREKAREERERKRAESTPNSQSPEPKAQGSEAAPSLEDLVKPGAEPRFVSSAYFMKFKFDAGSYAFAGREQLLGRDVLKIEYYPKRYFQDDDKRENPKDKRSDQEKEADEKIERKMDKVSMITMWIEPNDHQILQYEFSNIDFDFLPGRSLVRLDDLRASMRMREAFPGVWLPDTIAMQFGMSMAIGEIAAKYDVKYHDYKLAEVKARVR